MKKYKGYIVSLLAGAALMFSFQSYAAIGDTVSAVFAQFNYVVNGSTKTIDSPVLVYEGTSYVRTTDIANMLGFDVTYEADSRTIEFDNTDTVTQTTYASTPSPTPEPTVTPNPNVSSTGETTSTTLSDSPTPTPSSLVTASPTPSPSLTPAPTVTPSPTPDNTATCKAISDDYSYQITYTKYYDPTAGSAAVRGNKVLVLEYDRDQALADAGCSSGN